MIFFLPFIQFWIKFQCIEKQFLSNGKAADANSNFYRLWHLSSLTIATAEDISTIFYWVRLKNMYEKIYQNMCVYVLNCMHYQTIVSNAGTEKGNVLCIERKKNISVNKKRVFHEVCEKSTRFTQFYDE